MSTSTESEPRYCLAYEDPPNALPFNGIECVHMLATSPGKPPISCTFLRSSGTPNEPLIFNYRSVRGKEPPARLPSALPPPGNLSLSLSLGRRFGSGRAGGVYGAIIDYPKSNPELVAFDVPPVVIKISRPERHTDIEHEAYYYEEMESLQGIVIPRCYGFFRGEIPAGYFLLGEKDLTRRKWRQYWDSRDSSDSDSDSPPCEEPGYHDADLDDPAATEAEEAERPSEIPPIGEPRVISILLLEELAGRLPVRQELPVDLQAEILDMYSHFSQLGIDHIDIRHANILEAPICPPGWPSLMSPRTHNAYRFRIVDFDNSKKTNRSLEVFRGYYRCYVSRLLNGLKMGYIIEPWEW